MKFKTTSLLLNCIMVCGAQMFAEEAATAPTMVDAHATHRELMKDCMDKERPHNRTWSTDDVKKQCRTWVKARMQQMQDTGTMPSSSESEPSHATPQ
jgi:hypothetical protein